jgi:hypothetical protein
MDHLVIKGPILLPYLEKSNQLDLKFPYFYKIYSIIYPKLPIPSDVEVRAIFYNKMGTCCTGNLDSIKIKFEDYFLPISVAPQYRDLYSTKEGKIELRGAIFKKLWKSFKSDGSAKFVNSYRLIEFNRQAMIKAVFSRLGAFLIDEDFLSQDILINIPCTGELKDDIGDLSNEDTKVKTFYDLESRRFKKSAYDFIFDEFLEKNSENSHFAKTGDLKHGKYHLAEVLIFVPEK